MLQPIIGIISFVAAIVIFTSPFIEGNWILTTSIAVLILIEGSYHLLKEEKNIPKGIIKIISTITLIATLFVKIPFYLIVFVGIALIIVALYDLFSTITGGD